MQDTQTGALVPVSSLSQQDLDDALLRPRQGATFYVGEEVRVKGGHFAVHSIGRDMITLRGLPGTKLRSELKTAHQSAVDCVLAIVRQLDALPPAAQRALGVAPGATLEEILARALQHYAATNNDGVPESEPAGTVVITGKVG